MNFWFSLLILVKNNYKNGPLGHIWPIYYRTIYQIVHGGPICPNKNAVKSRFLLESIIGPRTLRTAMQLTASVAVDSKGKRPSADSDRRSSAISTGHSYGIWTDQTLTSQKWQRQNKTSTFQTACGFADRSCKEDSRQQRQFVENIEQSIVWQKERDRKAYSKAGYRPEDQHISYGTTKWHYKRPAGSPENTAKNPMILRSQTAKSHCPNQ
jgi:hypothetical protein